MKLKWKRKKDLPHAMWYYPLITVVEGRVFVGGGRASTASKRETLMIYDVLLDKWDTLLSGVMYYAMTSWNSKLMLVGGRDARTHKRISSLRVLDEVQDLKPHWSFPFPCMPTVRDGTTAVVHKNKWVLVIGGYDDDHPDDIAKVAILDTALNQWYISVPVPQPCGLVSAAIVGEKLMLLGGFCQSVATRKAFSVHLNHLIDQATSSSENSSTTSPWQHLPDTPLAYSTAFAFNGTLFAIGGLDSDQFKASTVIHMYQKSSNSWVEAAELPVGRYQCACAALSNGRIIVAGNGDEISKQVDVGVVL